MARRTAAQIAADEQLALENTQTSLDNAFNETDAETTAVTSVASRNIFQNFAQAISEIGRIVKSGNNPHFKSKFVELSAILDAVQPALAHNNLFLVQRLDVVDSRSYLITQIIDTEGASLPVSYYPIIAKDDTDPQKFGAGLTYARRYSLMAYLGIAGEDDDGNLAATPKPKPKTINELFDERLKRDGITSVSQWQDEVENRFGDRNLTRATLSEDQKRQWLDGKQTAAAF